MHRYRTHDCGGLRRADVGRRARLSGWVHRKRDHGHLLFVDLRDHYGLTQVVAASGEATFAALQELGLESVVTVTGPVVARSAETVNPQLATGEVELRADELVVVSPADALPFPVASEQAYPEETRLRYRYLELRRARPHGLVELRARVIAALREKMAARGFLEVQTPILTATSPEGARDYVVPARLHPGKFYALPQAPQMFKQILMVAGFDRYFQIAPCFRDEAARADRSPGEFYQLDLEMAFVEQEDVFTAVEPVLAEVFAEHGGGWAVDAAPFRRLGYGEALARYGTDKPDLRNPLEIADVSETFRGSGFSLFAGALERGAVVRAIPAPGAAARPRAFFDKLDAWARDEGAGGLGYVVFAGDGAKGPIAKRLDEGRLQAIRRAAGADTGDAVFFVCAEEAAAAALAGAARQRLGEELGLVEREAFRFCWVYDYPMYERDEETGDLQFSHNPFSMPQGGLEALETQPPLEVLAYQYDVVCNGVELGSGAIRNHRPEIMLKAFEIAGYSAAETERLFGSLLTAFRYGAPPHGGLAPGLDRMIMLLAQLPNIREGVCFPMTQSVEDPMMGAPSEISERHLKELHLKIAVPPKAARPDRRRASG